MAEPDSEQSVNLFSTFDNGLDYCNKYSIGQFNTNGWLSNTNPYNTSFKQYVLKCLDVDILILCETHCLNADIITIDSYTIFQHNRQPQGGERRGSGGIAIAIKTSLFFTHELLGVYKTADGILGLKLRQSFTDYTIGIMGNYLSPSNYHYGRDAENYFNHCSVLWETLSDCDLRVGAGDYNSRTKQEIDFSPDIDGGLVPPRVNLDQVKNAHGDSFISFLKDNRAVILNGRITPEFKFFTFVTSRGASVPDYIICPVENLINCESFKVLLMSDIVNMFNLIPPQTLPDHSFLLSSFVTHQTNTDALPMPVPPGNGTSIPKRKTRQNLNKIKKEFFMSAETQQLVQETITRLKFNVNSQNEIDKMWLEVKNIFVLELSKLPDLPTSNSNKNKKLFIKSQPF